MALPQSLSCSINCSRFIVKEATTHTYSLFPQQETNATSAERQQQQKIVQITTIIKCARKISRCDNKNAKNDKSHIICAVFRVRVHLVLTLMSICEKKRQGIYGMTIWHFESMKEVLQ